MLRRVLIIYVIMLCWFVGFYAYFCSDSAVVQYWNKRYQEHITKFKEMIAGQVPV